MNIPLRLGPLAVHGYEIQRSGFRWLCRNGRRCRPGEVLGWCNIGLAAKAGHTGRVPPFVEEARDFQIALATRHAGRLRKARGVSQGGFFDQHEWFHLWSPETVLGELECAAETVAGAGADANPLRMLFLAGRRTTELAEVRWGPLTGWHDRCRAWWADRPGDFGTLLSLGICEQRGYIRGENGAFLELFAAVPGPAHVVFVPDDVLVPTAAVLRSQLERTPADRERIAEDFAQTLGPALAAQVGNPIVCAVSWIFAGCLLKAVNRSPLVEWHEVLTPSGVRQVGPANAVLLSLHSEQSYYLRHKRLGYVVSFHAFRLSEAGPAVLGWLKSEFELVRRPLDEIQRDLLWLIDTARSLTGAHLLFLNCVSSSGLEDVFCYAPFDKPLGNTLAGVRAKELNVMLYQLARERDVSVVDVDALAADLGVRQHIPDGMHPSGRLQRAVRERIVGILRDRGVPGFGIR